MTTKAQTAGAVVGAVVLASAGMGIAAPLVASQATSIEAAATTAAANEAAAVNGTFAYTQDVVSSTSEISGIFASAASTLCQAMPQYIAGNGEITVNGEYTATVSEMSAEAGALGYILACACATNVAGGGAIVNAEVSGVSLASLL